MTLAAGDAKVCTITNTRIPTLTVQKVLLPAADSGTFGLQIDGQTKATGGNGATTGAVLSTIGAHSVGEVGAAGTDLAHYESSIGGDCAANGSVTLAPGDNKVCVITNRRKPTLTVTKVLVPANDPGTFGLQIDGQTKATGGNGTTTGKVELSSGPHTVAEVAAGATDLANYVSSIGGDCLADGSVSLAAGENKTCTITNTRKARLFVIKKVVNDNGGTAAPSDFTLSVNATDPTPASFKGADTPGVEVTLAPGAYSVAETGGPAGYTGSFSAACTGTIALGETKTCTVTNDDQPAKLIVKKIVINDNGGTKTAADFSFKVNNGSATAFEADGQNDLTVNAGNYTVTEPAAAGYTTTYDNCDNVALANGGTATCTITNNDQPAKLIVKKIVINDNGGTKTAADFSFKVNGGSATAVRGRRPERPHRQRRPLHGHRARSSRLHHHLRQLRQRCSRERRHRDLHDHEQRPAREADRQEDRHQRQRRHQDRGRLLVQAQRRQRGCLRGRRSERPDRRRRQLLGHRARSSRLHHHLRQLRQRRARQRRDQDVHDHQQRPAVKADRHQARRQRQRRQGGCVRLHIGSRRDRSDAGFVQGSGGSGRRGVTGAGRVQRQRNGRPGRLHRRLLGGVQRHDRPRSDQDLHGHKRRPAREADRQEGRDQRRRRHEDRGRLLVRGQRRQPDRVRGRRPERPHRRRRQLLGHRARS